MFSKVILLLLLTALINATPVKRRHKHKKSKKSVEKVDHAVIDEIIKHNEGAKGVIEGDIMVDQMASDEEREKRGDITTTARRWPQGIVPFTFEIDGAPIYQANQPPYAPIADREKRMVFDAMRELEKVSCIRFRERQYYDQNYIIFLAQSHYCWSIQGMEGGPQVISMGEGCGLWGGVESKSTAIHEIMHALGFLHEQKRFDRDDFVEIKWENIQTEPMNMRGQFTKELNAITYNVAYDTQSIMHYGNKAWTKNGADTIVNRRHPGASLGGEYLTSLDILQLSVHYNCANAPPCENYSHECKLLASQGQCRQSEWMFHNCKLECNECYCHNARFDCGNLSWQGYCSSDHYGEWMKSVCPKACGYCH